MYYNKETRRKYLSIGLAIICFAFLLIIFNAFTAKSSTGLSDSNEPASKDLADEVNRKEDSIIPDLEADLNPNPNPNSNSATGYNTVFDGLYRVLSVTDGDTFRVDYNGVSTPVRLIGVDTPETVDPRTTVQCFGKEASNYLGSLLTGKNVRLESDPTQSDRDKYGRLLRYAYLEDNDVAFSIIVNGFGHEYTYSTPHQKQTEYKNAEKEAMSNGRGLWAPNACNATDNSMSNNANPVDPTASDNNSEACNIKGNINNKGEKIYHMPHQKYYNNTKIDASKGERYFCSAAEAEAAGWRASKV
jgi:micrococcal nuclease